jgi:hypothetical protein
MALAVFGLLSLQAQTRIEIVVGDDPGVGFNDPTPVSPVGGNSGTTLGQQRLNVFRFAASKWANTLTTGQVIHVFALFVPLPCDTDGAVLGGAAPFVTLRDFGGGRPGTWYPISLAEKLTNFDFGPFLPPDSQFEVFAVFNSELGQPGCLDGVFWYYGLDTATPASSLNLATTVLHELGHGVGFTVGPTSSATGERAQGLPSIWETRLLDLGENKLWLDMDDSERQVSAVNTNNLVWSGGAALAAAPSVLSLMPELVVSGPASLSGGFEAQAAAFGGPISTDGVTGALMPAIDSGGESPSDACEPLDAQSAFSVAGGIALIDRGGCTYTVKATNVQNAGASGAVIVNNVPGGPPIVGGEDPSVNIPVLGISQDLGNALREQLRYRGRSVSGVRVTIRRNPSIRSGTTNGFPRMYAPSNFAPGSSVSHWDVSLTPDQLMEPFASNDTTFTLTPPVDLTFPLLQDIGW